MNEGLERGVMSSGQNIFSILIKMMGVIHANVRLYFSKFPFIFLNPSLVPSVVARHHPRQHKRSGDSDLNS